MVVFPFRTSVLATLLLLVSVFSAAAQDGEPRPRVSIETDLGTIVVELYNETPKHRDNFLKLAGEDVQIEPPDTVKFLGISAEFGARVILEPAFGVSLDTGRGWGGTSVR